MLLLEYRGQNVRRGLAVFRTAKVSFATLAVGLATQHMTKDRAVAGAAGHSELELAKACRGCIRTPRQAASNRLDIH